MFPTIFDIPDLAKMIVRFIPVYQLTNWIKVAFEKQQLVIAQTWIRWTSLLTCELYLVCKEQNQLAYLFAHRSRSDISEWVSQNPNLQFELIENNFLKFDDFYSNIDFLKKSFWRRVLEGQKVNVIQHLIQSHSNEISILCEHIKAKRFRKVRWTAPMLTCLATMSDEMLDALRIRFGARPFVIDDRACLDVLYQHHILDQSKNCEYFLRATDRLTIVILFETHYPIHNLFSANLVKHICKYHRLKEDGVAQLLRPLWFDENKSGAQHLKECVFQVFDPNSNCFQSTFGDHGQFLEDAIHHRCTKAIKWAVTKLALSREQVSKCFSLLLTKMHWATKRIADFIDNWPDTASEFLNQINTIMFQQSSCVIWRALTKHNLVNGQIFEGWKIPQWTAFAKSPSDFIEVVWQDTPTFHARHLLFFKESLKWQPSAAQVLWQKRSVGIKQSVLVQYASQFFLSGHFLILQSIVQNVNHKTILQCYENAAVIGTQKHFEFLQKHWPNIALDQRWIDTAIKHSNWEFIAHYYKYNKITMAQIKPMIDKSSDRCMSFLQSINFDVDYCESDLFDLI